MSFEYNVVTDKKIDFALLQKLCDYLKKNRSFEGIKVKENGLFISDKISNWELVGINLISIGLFVSVNLSAIQRNELLLLIQNFMQDQGLGVVIDEI
ncbi:MAG: hypothetical protein ACN6OI_19235 [Flavobacterium sp.]|uniref:hypothetical protein n=1 Tax=Flavobacterium sp. TaxID=239 RepID=UPI003D141125